MIGVFDSGRGGMLAISEIKRLMPHTDVCFYADRKNAPYGTKTREQLTELVKRDIDILKKSGAEKILMACCTASTVWKLLPEDYKSISLPIIVPSAKKAVHITKNNKIAVIATEHTAKSKAFTRAIHSIDKSITVSEFPAQELVYLAENRIYDIKKAERILEPLKDSDADTLILGCTHFPLLLREIQEILPNMKTVSSAREGAIEILKYTKNGRGKTVFIASKNEKGHGD